MSRDEFNSGIIAIVCTVVIMLFFSVVFVVTNNHQNVVANYECAIGNSLFIRYDDIMEKEALSQTREVANRIADVVSGDVKCREVVK